MRSNLSQDIGDFIFDSISHSTSPKGARFNFINVLREALMHADAKCVKMTVKLLIFFMLLGFTSVKALRKTLMKLTLGL